MLLSWGSRCKWSKRIKSSHTTQDPEASGPRDGGGCAVALVLRGRTYRSGIEAARQGDGEKPCCWDRKGTGQWFRKRPGRPRRSRVGAPVRCPVAAWRHHSGLALGKEKEGGGGWGAAQSGWEVSLESDGRTLCFGVLRARPSAQSPHPRISAQAVFAVPVSVSFAEGPKSRERESLTVPAQITRRPETARQGARVTATQ